MRTSSVWLLCVAACVTGCKHSDRVINLAASQIEVVQPKVMWTDRTPVAYSRDGTRIALLTTEIPGSIEVLDLPSMSIIASADLTEKSEFGGPMFSLDGNRLMLGAIREGDPTPYALNLQSNDLEQMETKVDPRFIIASYNYDRTIMVDQPFNMSEADEKERTLVLTASGHGFEIPPDAKWGFDQFGVLWSKSGGTWTRITRQGESTRGSAPKGALVPDQSKVRGSLELRSTSTEMEFKGATARVTSIWLWDHKAVPFNGSDSYQAALVFTGPDVDAFFFGFGFVPGQNLVHVVSSQGSYLIPFETKYPPSVPPPATK